MSAAGSFAQRVIRWQRQHGRHQLPWQNTRDPYRVWLSEIMLQQTQVQTVLRYYSRFLEAFPDVKALAAASEDAVLQLWSGLGYYSRARNLHRAARAVASQWQGEFPHSAAALATLPGIGPSTANAIASFCFGERVAILDANVRRVLARHLAFGEDLSSARAIEDLWRQADALLPHGSPEALVRDMPSYTQGMMDLGAQLCTPRQPRCEQCPVAQDCLAHRSARELDFPVRSRKLKRKAVAWWWLMLRDPSGRLWLQKRPDTGVWAGLYCFPSYASEPEMLQAVTALGLDDPRPGWLPALTHVLTHMDIQLLPAVLQLSETADPEAIARTLGAGMWADAQGLAAQAHGVPAPLRLVVRGLDGMGGME
ncbi:A/G-specific adenine glycosylase [Corticibacter populi]|uniref:Adenine DNA glycosylase n=1 Tax=Corticibacter populi TaxID=1550736 RepID=A0A3M6QLW4_9BURK|nr:A/G-specific adenine glycosylase [Corticibacter populi]RMX04070.1 A/G-specific adenine glycosylase [Corticibacter populi]RZS33076.1 A/G-specific DNA-adenine glycosylase [Corticibacter populi]